MSFPVDNEQTRSNQNERTNPGLNSRQITPENVTVKIPWTISNGLRN
jgi:hypothetical protein